jgi:hypothetical protein
MDNEKLDKNIKNKENMMKRLEEKLKNKQIKAEDPKKAFKMLREV